MSDASYKQGAKEAAVQILGFCEAMAKAAEGLGSKSRAECFWIVRNYIYEEFIAED